MGHVVAFSIGLSAEVFNSKGMTGVVKCASSSVVPLAPATGIWGPTLK